MWPILLELVSVSVALSSHKYFYSPMYGMLLVHCRIPPPPSTEHYFSRPRTQHSGLSQGSNPESRSGVQHPNSRGAKAGRKMFCSTHTTVKVSNPIMVKHLIAKNNLRTSCLTLLLKQDIFFILSSCVGEPSYNHNTFLRLDFHQLKTRRPKE